MKPNRLARMAFILCLLVTSAGIAVAQTVTGSLVGHIQDVNGAAIPGARIVATDVTRGTMREIITNEEGNYTFSSLDPGIYRIEVQQENFKKHVRENVEVAINTTVRADATLEAGAVSEVVQVEADQVLLKTDRADVSQQISAEQIQELPLSVDRNYQSTLEITPGVSEASPVGSSFGNSNGSLTNRVNGQNERYNNYQLDGTINNQTNVISQTVIVPPPEAIQVVDVSTNAYDAEQGRASGGVINVQIKSGTNDFRGSVFGYHTNSALKAKNAIATVEQPETKLTQFGFTFGGPIIKDKTFFFGDYQLGRDRRGQSDIFSVPTEAFRNGDFSAASSIVYDPGVDGLTPAASRPAFAGNVIPQNRINPVARAIMARLPLPNRPGLTDNYEVAGTFIQDRDSFDVKINHNFTDNTTGFIRYSFFNANTVDAPIFGIFGGPTANGGATAAVGPSRNHSVSANLTHVFSNSLISEFRFGYVRVYFAALTPTEDDLAKQLGIPGINQGDFFTGGMPRMTITGYDFLGAATTLPFEFKENDYNIVNNWTKTIGNHTIRFGADIRILNLDKHQASGSNPRGEFTFSAGVTARTGGASTNAFAAFLLGLPQQVRRTSVLQLGGFKLKQYFFFAQDRWQVNPKLTVNYGLRYEIYPYSTGMNDGDQSLYDIETNTSYIGGFGSVDPRMGIKTEYTNFAPRLGVAYRLDDKTVIRAGYGLSYVPIILNSLVNPIFGAQIDQQFQGTSAAFPARISPTGSVITLSTGIPAPLVIDNSSGIVIPPSNAALATTNPNAQRGYVQSYNFTAERDIYGFVTSVGYVGSRGTRLPGQVNINAAGPGSTQAQRPLNIRFGRTADTTYSDFSLSSAYHSLQTRVERRMGSVGRLTLAYTLAKTIDYADAFAVDNDIDINLNRGPSSNDRKHNLVFSHVLRLPFGRNGKFFKEGIGASIFGGFSLSGIFVARSGTPVNITGTRLTANATQGSLNRPDQIGKIVYLGGLGPGKKYFDISAFAEPSPGTWGNAGRNSVRGPSYFNYNLTMARTFRLTEMFKLQLQASAFNVTNTPHYADPNGNFTSTAFGESRSTSGERQIRLGAKLTF
ncbi:MAG: Cna protein B-type domain protein [Acidobacteria bacterium]|jgi:outer membrane receptor protein involved in Fe transport|nr:Cna protein B-type domain protein [Acidobacteriota bacterium]